MNFRRVEVLRLVVVMLAVEAIASEARAQGQADWWSRARVFRSRYYNVKTDLPEEQATELVKHMDATCDAYVAMFKGLQNRRPSQLDLYLFATQHDYLQTLSTRLKTDGTGSWGMCISRGRLISLVAWRGDRDTVDMMPVLQHEGFHQFARLLFSELPLWANEGLAEVFERGVVIDGKLVLGQVTAGDKQGLKAGIDGGFRSFEQLFTMQESEWKQRVLSGDAQFNYLQAWSIAHFFLYADDGKYQRQFLRFLVGLNRGADWKRSFVAAFGVPDFAAVEKKWREYVEQLMPTDYPETIRRMEFLAAGMMKLREKEIYPISIEEMKQALQKMDFKFTSELFGKAREMSASDERLFEVPLAEHNPANPTFQLVYRKGKKPDPVTMKTRRTTVPLNITTAGLEPLNFIVRWKRRGRDHKATFEGE